MYVGRYGSWLRERELTDPIYIIILTTTQVDILHNGSYLSLNGTFRLQYNGSETGDIAHDATALQVETALQALPGLSGRAAITIH